MSDRRPPNPKQIRWCVSHSASTPPGADWCWPWDSGYAAQPGAAECFVVPMMLTDPDLMAAVRRGVESGTIKGTELNLCHVHGSVMTGAVFHEGTRVCQYAWYSGHAVEACFGYRGVVIPVSDGGSET